MDLAPQLLYLPTGTGNTGYTIAIYTYLHTYITYIFICSHFMQWKVVISMYLGRMYFSAYNMTELDSLHNNIPLVSFQDEVTVYMYLSDVISHICLRKGG